MTEVPQQTPPTHRPREACDRPFGCQGSRDPRFRNYLTKHSFAFVLAGGRGSRLMHLTDGRAKPAVPFGGKFRIIDFTLSNCVNSGVRRIGVATQYRATSLIQHLQRAWAFLDGRFDEYVQLLPAQQQSTHCWYRGTADAVLQNLSVVHRSTAEFVLVLAADHIYKMDYAQMLAEHVEREADLTVACVDVPPSEAGEFGIIGIDDEWRIIGRRQSTRRTR